MDFIKNPETLCDGVNVCDGGDVCYNVSKIKRNTEITILLFHSSAAESSTAEMPYSITHQVNTIY